MQDFDKLLGDVLQEEAKAEPLHGLEDRVMLRVRSATNRKRAVRRWIAIGMVTTLAGAVIATVAFRPKRASAPEEISTLQVTARRAQKIRVEPAHASAMDRPSVVRMSVRRSKVREIDENPSMALTDTQLPKLDVFPSPVTPSPEELALRRLAEHTNLDSVSLEQRQTETVHIAEITIQPILEERP